MKALRQEFKSGLIAAGVGFVVGGIFFATVKNVSKTEAYGYGGVVLYASLVSAAFGLVTTGSSLAVGKDDDGVKPHSVVRGGSAAIALPQPVDGIARLGENPGEQTLTNLNWKVATGQARPELLVEGLRELNRYQSGHVHNSPGLAEDLLPAPAPQTRPEAIPMPAPRYEPPTIERIPPSTPAPKLWGMEEDDLWDSDDSMSAFDEGKTEDIFA